MSEIVANELDYKQYDRTHPTYFLTRVLSQSGGNSWSISAAGQEILLQLPVTTYNLSKSILYFQILAIDAAANANPPGINTLNIQQWLQQMQCQ
jgi:hypothetical protein